MKPFVLLPIVLLPLLTGSLLPPCHADTPAQAQQAIQAACNRACAGYSRRDLPSIMALYAPEFVLTVVVGRKYNFRVIQAGVANDITRSDYHRQTQGMVSQVTLHGQTASAIIHWHFTKSYPRSAAAPAYRFTRDFQEQSLWKKTSGGWQEVKAQETDNIVRYRR